jgi:Heterokaryon incompatibility protein (HET)
MGIQYLWIDALCIQQDSTEDWMTESSKMGQIYQNACFVLSADVASGADIGFLKGTRDVPTMVVDLALELRHEEPDLMLTVCEQSEGGYPDAIHDLFWTSEWGYNGETAEDGKNPTFHRGWCLQERYLTTRIVHFTSSEMFWECRQMTCCECGFFPRDRAPRKQQFHWYQQAIKTRNEGDFANTSPDPWWELLREYSERKLSFDSDRLTAFSGLARTLQDTEKGPVSCRDLAR